MKQLPDKTTNNVFEQLGKIPKRRLDYKILELYAAAKRRSTQGSKSLGSA